MRFTSLIELDSKASEARCLSVFLNLLLGHRVNLLEDFLWTGSPTSMGSEMRINRKHNIFKAVNANWTFLKDEGYLSRCLWNLRESAKILFYVWVLSWDQHVLFSQMLNFDWTGFLQVRWCCATRRDFIVLFGCGNIDWFRSLNNTEQGFRIGADRWFWEHSPAGISFDTISLRRDLAHFSQSDQIVEPAVSFNVNNSTNAVIACYNFANWNLAVLTVLTLVDFLFFTV